MSTPVLLDKMTQIVEGRREKRLNAARNEANTLVERARQHAIRRQEEALKEVAAESERQRAQARMRAEGQAEKEELTLRDRVVDTALAKVRERIQGLARSPEFGPILEALLEEVVDEAPHDAVVEAPAQQVARCREWLRAHGRGGMEVVEGKHIVDGVLLRNREHTYRVSNTLTSRFNRVESKARTLCMRRLFGEEEQP